MDLLREAFLQDVVDFMEYTISEKKEALVGTTMFWWDFGSVHGFIQQQACELAKFLAKKGSTLDYIMKYHKGMKKELDYLSEDTDVSVYNLFDDPDFIAAKIFFCAEYLLLHDLFVGRQEQDEIRCSEQNLKKLINDLRVMVYETYGKD